MDSLRRSRLVAFVLAVVAWFALGLQFGLMLQGVFANSRPLLPALGQFFIYFTILTNLQAAVVLTRAGLRQDQNDAGLETATAVYIAMVGLGYSLLLRHMFHLAGWLKVADHLLHDVMPVLFVLWWIFLARKAHLAWSSLPGFLVWPLIYLALALVIGAFTSWYPYPFVNAQALGYPKVLTMSAALLMVTAALSAIAIGFSRWRSKPSTA